MGNNTIDNLLDSTEDSGFGSFDFLSGLHKSVEEEKRRAEEAAREESAEKETENAFADNNSAVTADAADTDMVYTAQQIAKEMGMVKQTVHNYTEQYPGFIRPDTDEKGQKYYSAVDVKVIKRISELKKQRLDQDSIRGKLMAEFGDRSDENPQSAFPATLTPPAAVDKDEFAALVSSKVEEQIRTIFEIGMKGISTRLDSVSNTMDEMGKLIKQQNDNAVKGEKLTRNLEGAVSRNTDAVSDLQKNMTGKLDRSMSRNEVAFNRMQDSLDRNNSLIETELKGKLNENMDGITSLQKDVERIRSNNVSKKVEEVGKSIQDTLSKEKAERERQTKELLKIIEEAMTPPEYHPEESREYKNLDDKYKAVNEKLEQARRAVKNMNDRVEELEEAVGRKDKQLSTQLVQITALNGQIQQYKKKSQELEQIIHSYSEMEKMREEESQEDEYIVEDPDAEYPKEMAEAMPENTEMLSEDTSESYGQAMDEAVNCTAETAGESDTDNSGENESTYEEFMADVAEAIISDPGIPEPEPAVEKPASQTLQTEMLNNGIRQPVNKSPKKKNFFQRMFSF